MDYGLELTLDDKIECCNYVLKTFYNYDTYNTVIDEGLCYHISEFILSKKSNLMYWEEYVYDFAYELDIHFPEFVQMKPENRNEKQYWFHKLDKHSRIQLMENLLEKLYELKNKN